MREKNCTRCGHGYTPVRRLPRPWRNFGPAALLCPTCDVAQLEAAAAAYARAAAARRV